MSKYRIADALAGKCKTGTEIKLSGWVRTRRDSKAGLSFVNLHDGSCFDAIQLIVESSLDNYQSEVLKLTAGCSITATGILVESPGKGQSFEIQVSAIEVLGWVEDPDTYPISPKRHTMEYLRDVAHLRSRTNIIGAVTRVRNTVAQAIHRFFHDNGFYWIHTPIITGSDTEGAGEMFRVSTLDLANLPLNDSGQVDFKQDFFGKETFLTVSGQLNLESYCLSMSKVYSFGPTFRAENSNTSRHLAEFWMVEPEIAFADLAENADLSEQLLKAIAKAVLNERQDDMEFFNQRVDKQAIARLENIANSNFARMNYTEAVDILKSCDRKFEYPVEWGVDLQSEHERYLAEEHVGRPIVLMNYPKDIKAFYMRMNDDERTVAAMDVLAPGIGEIIGGSQREERLDVLTSRISEMNLDIEDYSWYIDFRRYGTVPHSGFGLGFDRTISYITGVANIRDVIPFPRAPRSADF